jgi:hypothetical protein
VDGRRRFPSAHRRMIDNTTIDECCVSAGEVKVDASHNTYLGLVTALL